MDREITLRDYGRVLWSGRWVILACVLVAAVIGALLTVARPTQYTATSKVFMGQATTISGIPVQTPLTNPTTAPSVLESDEVVERVAARAEVTPGRIRDTVTLSAPRVTGQQGNLPTLLTVTAVDENRRVAIDAATAYAEEVLRIVGGQYGNTREVYERQLATSRAEVAALEREVRRLRAQLVGASGGEAVALQTALLSAGDQLRSARQTAEDQAVLLSKSEQIERPAIVSLPDSASSSGAAPRRLQSIVLAGLIGLIVGIIAVFVWKGSPAGRAAE